MTRHLQPASESVRKRSCLSSTIYLEIAGVVLDLLLVSGDRASRHCRGESHTRTRRAVWRCLRTFPEVVANRRCLARQWLAQDLRSSRPTDVLRLFLPRIHSYEQLSQKHPITNPWP